MRVYQSTWAEVDGAFLPNECSAFAPEGDLQRAINRVIYEVSKRGGIPPLLTLDAHFVSPDRKPVQDILLQNGNPNGWRFSTTYCQLDTEGAWSEWVKRGADKEFPGLFERAVEGNHELASRVGEIELPSRIRLPEIDIPPDIRSKGMGREEEWLELVIKTAMEVGRLDTSDPVQMERIRMEIGVIANNGVVNLLPYFLFVRRMIKAAIDMDIPVGPGRGSAAGCFLSYCLGITHLDPIRYGLSFERFLSSSRIKRGKFPDIDMDFGDVHAMGEWLEADRGDKMCRICTVTTMKMAMAMKEVCRVLLNTKANPELFARIEEVTKSLSMIPMGVDGLSWLDGYERDGTEYMGELERNPLLRGFFEEYPEVESMVRQVLGIPKAIGKHAAGYCVADVPIDSIVPTCEVKGHRCTQFTMGPVEAFGIIKFDILGLNTLNDIHGCLKLLRERRGSKLDMYSIPLNDRATWKNFADGKNETVFQFSGGIGVDLSKRIRPKSLEDLAEMTAAGRPGTMEAMLPNGVTMLDQWVEYKAGRADFLSLHPSVDPILEPTGGSVLFQEQIMKMFQDAAGFSGEEADEIREIIGKKKADKMVPVIQDIRGRLSSSGWKPVQIEAFISLCRAASNYSFNKSHAIAYAYLGYVCQYLKVNYPIEWWTSILQNSSKDDLKANAGSCAHLVLPPDINRSALDFFIISAEQARLGPSSEVEVRAIGGPGERIVFPLRMVHGVKSAAEEIFSKRPFSSMEDFYNRVDRRKVNKGTVSHLIWAGAFDDIGGVKDIEDRNVIMEEYLRLRGAKKELEEYERLSKLQAMLAQEEAMPLGAPDYAQFIQEELGSRIMTTDEALSKAVRSRVSVGGRITRIKKIKTKKGDDMGFVDILSGSTEASITVFPELWASEGRFLRVGQIIYSDSKVDEYRGQKKLLADSLGVFYESEQPHDGE